MIRRDWIATVWGAAGGAIFGAVAGAILGCVLDYWLRPVRCVATTSQFFGATKDAVAAYLLPWLIRETPVLARWLSACTPSLSVYAGVGGVSVAALCSVGGGCDPGWAGWRGRRDRAGV